MLKKHIALIAFWILFMLPGPAAAKNTEDSLLQIPFQQIAEQARNHQVRWYMFGGWAHVNAWVDTYVAGEMKKRYDIDLVRVPMDAGIFINKLLNEKAAGKKTGNIDLLWINGENFKNAKEAGLLFGPFAQQLPNIRKYVDPESMAHDFGYPVEGYEAPYGRAQFVFEYDTAAVSAPPQTITGLNEWIRANPGSFTYPQPPDFTGSAFIRQLFYAVTGGHEQYLSGWDPDLFARKAPLLWNWLNAIEPFLWQKGQTYPKDSAFLDTLFSRGEVAFGMSYHPSHAQNKILEGSYPKSVRTFVMKDGSIYNTHFTAIPFNAPNKAGAMVLADFLISMDAQLSKYHPDKWGDFPALDLKRLNPKERKQFQSVDLGPATLGSDTLNPVAVPEIPSDYLEALEQGWKEHVLDN
ncbi:ABC transporter substrate-binding protein [Desulfobacula sp.]|uniref:ABC transporter substrate-binding protein n=1 Tax=Desulfobacula sp. TaxID=2593537 RepID=UPI002618E891|nr:ABC transporter substrate-binding protein [Desulfobacula sp.]